MGSKTGRRETQSGGPPRGNRSHRCQVPMWPGGLEQAERRGNGLRTETGSISIKRGLVVGKEVCEEGQHEWSECSVMFQTAASHGNCILFRDENSATRLQHGVHGPDYFSEAFESVQVAKTVPGSFLSGAKQQLTG